MRILAPLGTLRLALVSSILSALSSIGSPCGAGHRQIFWSGFGMEYWI